MSRYQKGKTNLDFTEARDSEWQWHQQVVGSMHLTLWRTLKLTHQRASLDSDWLVVYLQLYPPVFPTPSASSSVDQRNST